MLTLRKSCWPKPRRNLRRRRCNEANHVLLPAHRGIHLHIARGPQIHSGLMPANFTTLAHFAVSSAMTWQSRTASPQASCRLDRKIALHA